MATNENEEVLINHEGPCVELLLEEYKQAGVLPNGFYDVAYNQETRRMIWGGQSPDGRKWDENMPEGELARPWNGCSDTRVPLVDGVCNDETALLCAGFERAELRASAVDPDRAELQEEVSKYLHWMVHTRYRRPLRLEVELAAQYSREHGFCVAYVGWERELGKRRVKVTLDQLSGVGAEGSVERGSGEREGGADAGETPALPGESLAALITDPSREEEAIVRLREVYGEYVRGQLEAKGFFKEELLDEQVTALSVGGARRAVRELREGGETEVPLAYVCRNQPLVWVGQPFLEILAARGTTELNRARAVFWRRWMTEAELEGKRAEGWDPEWIEAVKKTKGNLSSWAGALGATSITGPSTKTVGNTTYLKITEENNPLIEVVYGHVRKVDEDGVTGIWETVFSPHITKAPSGNSNNQPSSSRETSNSKGGKLPDGRELNDFCAVHHLLDYAHGRYPYVELKRENIGRGLTDSRSVGAVAGTWQNEEKKQRDMLFNRADWDTLPPVRVPRLGGVDYRLGPGAQVPLNKNQEIAAINLEAPPANLALELVQLIGLRVKGYFGQGGEGLDPALTAARQGKNASDFFSFWGEVLLHMFALTLQYNPEEIVRVTGNPELGKLEATAVLDEFDFGLVFDVAELNPDFLMQKMKAVHEFVLPADAGGVIDRSALTGLELRMVDPRLAARLVQDKGTAAQKVYDDVDLQVARMALGNEGKYVANDPTAGNKLEYLRTVVETNPKYQVWLGKEAGKPGDERFIELMTNYEKNLQMSVMQEENKTVGRIGVRRLGAGK